MELERERKKERHCKSTIKRKYNEREKVQKD